MCERGGEPESSPLKPTAIGVGVVQGNSSTSFGQPKVPSAAKRPKDLVESSSSSYEYEKCVEGERDVKYFRQLHSTACTKLEALCTTWEEKSATLEQDTDPGVEEVLGQIRTSCCQARLLIRQKLKQYIGLVDMAESSSGQQRTTPQDLQGFWDMVYFQVDGLYKTFQELAALESNGWVALPPSPKKSKILSSKKHSSVKLHFRSGATGEQLEASRRKRATDRAKFRELRARQRKSINAKENQDLSDIQCTLFP